MAGDEIAQAARAAYADNRGLPGSRRRAMIDSGAAAASPAREGPSAPARPGDVGPLAELARLIEQDETFAAIVRDGRSEQRGELSDRPQGGPSGEPHDPHEHGEADTPDYSNGLPDQRRGLKVFAALVGLALAGSASAFAYWAWSDGRTRGDTAPVTGASIGPDKIMPSPQAGSRSDERLPGQPVERSVTARTMTGAQEPADAKPPAAAQAPPPRAVVYGAAPTKLAGLTYGSPPPGIPAPTEQKPPPDGEGRAPGATAPAATEPNAAPGYGYVGQLSSQRSEAAAQATSPVLQTKHPDVFGGRQPFIRRSDLGDRGVYYRVLAGPFAIGEAKQLCGDLKKSGADCVVQKN